MTIEGSRDAVDAPEWWHALAAQIGTEHRVAGLDIALVLADVTPPRDRGSFVAFALLFTGPLTPVLESGTHRLAGPHGEQDMGLAPLGPTDDGTGWRYEAGFTIPIEVAP